MSMFKWKIEYFADRRRHSKPNGTLISPIYETVHPIHGPLEFTIICYVGKTEKFSAWMRFDQSVCRKLNLKFHVDFWLEGSNGMIDKEILLNSKYPKHCSQGTFKSNFPFGYKDFDSLTVCFNFPLDVTSVQAVPRRYSITLAIDKDVLQQIFRDTNWRGYLTCRAPKKDLLSEAC